MNWSQLRTGLFDELEKIAQVDLSGLSSETVMSSKAPPEISSPGFAKAKSILDMAEQLEGEIKTAEEQETHLTKAKRMLGYSLAGTGVGKAIGRIHSTVPAIYNSINNPALSAAKRFSAGSRVNKIEHGLLIGGSLTGAALGAYRDHKKRKIKTSSFSPAMTLKATQQVGKTKNVLHAGPGIKSQISGQLIGRKGL